MTGPRSRPTADRTSHRIRGRATRPTSNRTIRLAGPLRRASGGRRRDEGQISVLILGLFCIVVLLVIGAIDVTAAQLARMRLLDTADALALGAADALDEAAAYGQGVPGAILLTNQSVQAAAQEHLARTPLPTGISDWALVAPTGTHDGQTAVVRLQGQATLPMTGGVLSALGGGVTITVESRARAPLQ